MVAWSAIVETFVDVEVGDEGLVPVLGNPHKLRLPPGVGRQTGESWWEALQGPGRACDSVAGTHFQGHRC